MAQAVNERYEWDPHTQTLVLVESEVVEIPDEPTPEPETDIPLATLVAAEEARRIAFDEVISGGTLSNARLRDAQRAGSEAFLAALS